MGDFFMKYFWNYLLIIVFIGICLFAMPFKYFSEKSIAINLSGDYDATNKEIDGSNTKKYLALTFDDGPSKYTEKIIALLKEYDYHATFFVLGTKLRENNKDILQMVVDNGNELGVHGYSHKSFTKLSLDTVQKEITDTRNLITELTGFTSTLVRPPYGNINNKIRSLGYGPYILWNNDSLDWKYRNSKKIYERVIKNVESGSIILMHDTYSTTFEALKLILPYLKENNYEVVSVSKLYSIYNTELEKTKSYRYVS